MRYVFAPDVLACPPLWRSAPRFATVQNTRTVQGISALVRPRRGTRTALPPGGSLKGLPDRHRAARAALRPAQVALDDVLVARAPSPGGWIKVG